ncbi:uncharacterized protein AKAW2_30007S [Aspergillus luchuensis]|uniref:Chitin synthase export chaperone n=2 Tax=Aspergillus subgen. Circumdati TaxID=2720871 RepID=A0A3F3PJD3_9EURO|nr:hypothetical protein BDQ94DRAFT_185709 [Aspergillus welwitschiae]XP_041540454.1 uncharacterized protein AKAW2_30007S [Aspergillus luchuensis]GAA92943.1 hypothetical protein AKAW_11056 [Aspergillus luchuensis IFO 4308]RDH26903.1 hypothetical protein BDQ94DRAFT_185709 [Aspergillus welwitschiae]BCR96688.1 hypothetical protein AKAW2_30007S [Aspergillus luchuensis]BCS09190.1 hypothetical protein ALUC_30007S [Aspergillus luchuensis]GAT21863.1 hypothetical protein RIB2604_01200110 [Aspergillus lu
MIWSEVRGGDLPIIFIRLFELLYLSLSAANYLFNFVILPVDQAQNALGDGLTALAIFSVASTLSLLCICTRLGHRTSHLERAAVIVLMAVAASAFVYVQFFYDTWIARVYFVILIFTAVQCLSHGVNFREGTFFDFPFICLGYGIIVLAPAMHAGLWSSTCRQALLPSYLVYVGLNALGGLNLIFNVPERLGMSSGSRLVLHCCAALATIYLFNSLLAALQTDIHLEVERCGRIFG